MKADQKQEEYEQSFINLVVIDTVELAPMETVDCLLRAGHPRVTTSNTVRDIYAQNNAQLKWLESTLQAGAADPSVKWTIVMGH